MKRILLICNEVVADAFSKGLRALFANQTSGACECLTIKSSKEWSSFQFTDKGFDQIFIQVELAWSGKVREGYDIANDLIYYKLPDSSIAHLRFISTKSRSELRVLTSTSVKHLPYVKSFLHLQWPIQQLEPFYFSRQRYNYLRNYCLTTTGQLDQILHDLQKYVGNPDNPPLEEEIKHVIVMGEFLTGADAHDTAQEIAGILKFPLSSQDQEIIRGKLINLIKQLEKKRDEKQEANIIQLPYRAMLVEDNAAEGKLLKELLSPYFLGVDLFHNGEKAKEALSQNSKTHAYQALFVDMELLEDGFDQPVMGVDLLEFCETSAHEIATRVISALPRRALSVLLSKPVEHILHKNKTGSILSASDHLSQVFKTLKNEIEVRKKYINRPGPVNGPFGEDQRTRQPKVMKNLYYKIKLEDPDKHQKMMQAIQHKAEAFFSGELDAIEIDCDFGRLENLGWEENEDTLELILLHRAIALLHNKENGQIFYGEFDIKEEDKAGKAVFKGLRNGYCDKFSPRLGDNAKGYFVSKLGFNGNWNKPIGSRLYQEIAEMNLFPEEENWLESVDPELLLSQLLSEDQPAAFRNIEQGVQKLKNLLANNAIKLPGRFQKLLKIKDLKVADLNNYLQEWEGLQKHLRAVNASESIVDRTEKIRQDIQQAARG